MFLVADDQDKNGMQLEKFRLNFATSFFVSSKNRNEAVVVRCLFKRNFMSSFCFGSMIDDTCQSGILAQFFIKSQLILVT